MLATGQRAFGAARTALCLGLTLFILFSGAVVFLSSEPGERSWITRIFESMGLLDDAGDGTHDGAAGDGDGVAASSPSGTASGTTAGSAGLDGAGAGAPEVTPDSASVGGAGATIGLFSEETTIIAQVAPRSGRADTLRGFPPGFGSRERVRAGTLYDLSTGATLTGARILATAYHGTNDPLNAGYPALFQDVVQIETDGSFHLPIFDPDDPRLLVHLQIDHPSYLPQTVVLERRETVAPEWQQREIRLRPSLTARVQISTADRRPLTRVPVRVTPTHDGHALLERETVWVALRRSERLIASGEPSVRYTDDAGYLRLPFSENFYFLEILHPLYVLSHRDPQEDLERVGEILYHVSETLDDRLVADELMPYFLTVFDEDRVAIPDSEVEIDWLRTFRTVTDEDGRLLVGLDSRIEFPPGPNATATVMTPAFFKRGVRFRLPNPSAVIEIPSRPSRRFEFRTMTHPDESLEEEPAPISPEGVRVDVKGLTLVRRSLDGQVAFQGAVPRVGKVIKIHVRGYLPREVIVPSYTREATSVDLGEIAFVRGLEKKIVLKGVDRQLLEEATLIVSPVERPQNVQRYPLRGADVVIVGGLGLGLYSVGVEGRYLRAFSGTFEVSETELKKRVLIPLQATDEETVVVRGTVVGLAPIDMARLSVIESYFIEGVRKPIVMKSYPPASDGTIGSVRRLSRVAAVHLSVVSLEDDAVNLQLPRVEDTTVFDAGEVRLFRRPNAEITFLVPRLGRLHPPVHVTLKATDGLEAHSRFRSRHRRLFIDNLRDGFYQLSWAVGDGGKETFGFEVRSRQTTKLTVTRSLFAEETVEVRIVDSLGNPLPQAGLSSGSLPRDPAAHSSGPALRLGLDPGVKLARVKTRERTRMIAFAGGYLATRAEVDPGGVVPTELTLYRPASAEALVQDADGIELDGTVFVSWEPKVPSNITYGEPFEVDVRDGRFRGDLFPPLPMRFTFRLADSETSITRVFSLPEDGDPQDLGVLRFEETRALPGVVLLPDGSPAPGVTVALLDFDKAWRFPLRDPRNYDQVRYKAETDIQGGFTIEELPLDLSTNLVLVAHRDGFGDAYEFPLDRESESHELQLEVAAGLELDVGYRDGLVRGEFRFSLEYQADPADPESRVDLGEIPSQLFGLNTFPAIEPGLYRVKWGLRDFYDPIPPISEEVFVEPGLDIRLQLLLDGRELRGKASLNGQSVLSGWMLLSEASGISTGTTVGRITDGRFLMIDPPRAVEVYGAVIPESKPQALQNIARGEALPVRIHGYTAALRNRFLNFGYSAYDLKLKFSDHFLGRYPGAYLTFPHYEWSNGRFASFRGREPITSSFVRFHLLPPGIHTFTVRSERGALLVTRPISLPIGVAGQLPNGLMVGRDNEVQMK